MPTMPSTRARAAKAINKDAVEAGGEAESGVERKRADERAGCKALRLEKRRQRRQARREPVPAVLAETMLKRIGPGEHARMRRQCDHAVRVGEGKADAGSGKGIDVGRPRRPSVAPQRIAAERVDGDQEHVLVGCRGQRERSRRTRPASHEQGGARGREQAGDAGDGGDAEARPPSVQGLASIAITPTTALRHDSGRPKHWIVNGPSLSPTNRSS